MVTYQPVPAERSADLRSSSAETQHTIVVPIANPYTAPVMLELACAIAGREEGHVIALMINQGPEPIPQEHSDYIRKIIRTIRRWEHTCEIELLVHQHISVVRGILEIAQRYEAEQILLGLTDPDRGHVDLGPLVRAIIDRAPCDVLVYRDSASPGFKRVIVPVGGSVASRVTVKMGLRLSQGTDRPCEVLHVNTNNRPEWESQIRVEKMLAGVRGHKNLETRVVSGLNEADTVLANAGEDDMLVVGKSERSALEKWLYGHTTQRLLDRASGPVLLVARSPEHSRDQIENRRFLGFLRPVLADYEQEQIVWSAQDTASPSLDYFVLIIIASIIASMGLLSNSGAVVIGAMLVAPLMGPIVSFGVGLCTARFKLLRQAAITIILGASTAFTVGFLLGKLIPLSAPTQELLNRGFPSILDAVIAMGAGFIAAYGMARRGIPAALSGVAIAAALVPPVNAIGLNLAAGEMRLAMGAALLFFTNLISIALVAALVFFWLGMRPQRLENQQRRRAYFSIVITMVMIVPLVAILLQYGHRVSKELISPNDLMAVFAPAEIVNIDVISHDPVIVQATLLTSDEVSRETIRIAQDMLSSDLGQPVKLHVIVQRFVQVQDPVEMPTTSSS